MSNRQYFTDSTGKWVGSVTNESNGRKTYLDATGGLAGRVFDNKTFDSKGKFVGNGDQGTSIFGKKNK